MARYAVTQLADIAEVTDVSHPFRTVREHFGITTFGVNAMTARAAGDEVIKEHAEAEPESGEELYVVTAGHATFTLDGEHHDAPTGTYVHVSPGVVRSATAVEAGTTVLVIGGGPAGQAYAPNGWELFAPLMALFESEEFELGADRGAELIAEHPGYSLLYYNVACFESRAGRSEFALDHLRQGIELQPSLAELARADDDFTALRGDVAFAELVGVGD